ncbi:MAG: hypothetical protein IAE94_10275 [Chthoniobacterales bacterium]|nr:hypothetical protein [Chthoniobacterales bacterium]
MKTHLILLLSGALAVHQASALSLRCDGVLGNSGADGSTLVHYEGADFPRNGGNSAGLAYDRLGALWTFGGTGNLMRLSLDGRMLGSYPLTLRVNENRSLVLAGDLLLVRVGERLFKLPITAPSGTPPEELPDQVKEISLNAIDGKIGLVTKDGRVLLWDAASGAGEELGMIESGDRARWVAVFPGGRVVLDGRWTYQAGKGREALKTKLNAAHQVVGDHVYEFVWHMTVARRNLALEPAPGVIYGGSSGYVINSLPEDGEMSLPNGLAHLGGNRFAVVGPVGVIHMVVFDEEQQAFRTVRRLGGIHLPGPLVLDDRGRTWYYSGFWEWTDNPSHILRGETGFSSRDVKGMQGAVLPDGQLVFPYLFRGMPTLMHRTFDSDDKKTSSPVQDIPKDPTGLAIFQDGKDRLALVVDAAGSGCLLSLDANGKVRKSETRVRLELTSPTPAVTSLGVLPDGRFLAADQGAVVLLERSGKTFKEISRWNTWGEEKFGSEIFLDVAGDCLWVSDTDHNRVVLFALQDGKATPEAVYAGEGLETPLNRPLRIAAAGDRAVVMDWGNQRLVKLLLGK